MIKPGHKGSDDMQAKTGSHAEIPDTSNAGTQPRDDEFIEEWERMRPLRLRLFMMLQESLMD